MVRYPLLSLAFSAPVPDTNEWEKIATLPVEKSTLITVKGHLLAVGGWSVEGHSTKDIRQYNPSTNSWQVICYSKIARHMCASALLPENKLIVVGGTPDNELIEVATIF